MKTNYQKKIIFLNGPPKSGKDEVANYLYQKKDFMTYSFASPIREIAEVLFDFYDYREWKETPLHTNGIEDDHYTGRDFLIDLSENFMKPRFGDDVWTKLIAKKVYSSLIHFNEPRNICISDLGFSNEFNSFIGALISTGFFLIFDHYKFDVEIWQIHRAGTDFGGDSRGYVLPKAEEMSYTTKILQNDFENLKDLYRQVDFLLTSGAK